MGARDVAGVLSRAFVVGWFLPSFFAVIATWNLLPEDSHTHLAHQDFHGDLLALGGIALLLALLLTGLWNPMLRTLQGHHHNWMPKRVRAALTGRQRRLLEAVEREIERAAEPEEREFHTWRRNRKFPRRPERLLPTRFGNEMRAHDDMALRAWGLDAENLWPRIEALAGDSERQLLDEARSELALFVNLAVLTLVSGCIVVIDRTIRADSSILDERDLGGVPVLPELPLLDALVFAALVVVFYQAAFPALSRWRVQARSLLDLHRLELFERLGLPVADADDARRKAPAVNDHFESGMRLP